MLGIQIVLFRLSCLKVYSLIAILMLDLVRLFRELNLPFFQHMDTHMIKNYVMTKYNEYDNHDAVHDNLL